jgi:hypothetical protein
MTRIPFESYGVKRNPMTPEQTRLVAQAFVIRLGKAGIGIRQGFGPDGEPELTAVRENRPPPAEVNQVLAILRDEVLAYLRSRK